MLNFRTILFFICLTFVSSNAYSDDIKPYFKADQIDPELLTNPALPGSEKYEKEVKYIIKLQKNPDLNEVDKSFIERHLKPEMIGKFVIKDLVRDQYPKLYKLLDRVHRTSSFATSKAKHYWNMKRPYVAIKEIKPLIAAHSNPAYPSGHTTSSYTIARVLSLVFPEKKAQFLARAQEIANHRVLVGMHFPQDLDAGRELSLLVVGGLLQDAHFLKDLKKARKEVSN